MKVYVQYEKLQSETGTVLMIEKMKIFVGISLENLQNAGYSVIPSYLCAYDTFESYECPEGDG